MAINLGKLITERLDMKHVDVSSQYAYYCIACISYYYGKKLGSHR